MNPVLVPNIIITDNPELSRVFNSVETRYTSFSKYLEDIQSSNEDNDFIFFTNENTEILSFEFDVGSSKPGGSGYQCSVEFIETGSPFERKLLRSNIQKVKNSNGKDSYNNRVFYLAFGVGDDLSYWSRFNACPLIRGEVLQAFNQPKTIKLTFSIASMDVSLDNMLLHRDINTDGLVQIEFNNIQERGFLSDRDFNKNRGTKKFSECKKPEEKIVHYLHGFNSFDSKLKQVTVDFLRTIYSQVPNVFFVTDDLKKLLFNKITIPNYYGVDKVNPDIFDLAANNLIPADATQRDVAEYLSLNEAVPFNTVIETLPGKVQDFLGLSLVIDTENLDSKIPFLIKFALTQEDSDDPTLEAKKEKLRSMIENLREGIQLLSNVECVLIRESESEIISKFFETVPESTRKLLSMNPNSPIIMFGQKDIIRSLLYGDEYEGIDVFNQDAQKYIKDRINVYNLYGSHHNSAETDEDSIETRLRIDEAAQAYPDFPMFRYNVTNSNILSLNVERNNSYTGFLQASFTKPVAFSDSYSLDMENTVLNILLGAKAQLEGNQYQDSSVVREDLFDIISSPDISKELLGKGANYRGLDLLNRELNKLKEQKDKIFNKLFDDKKFLKFFEFILSLYSTSDDSGNTNIDLKKILENKFKNKVDLIDGRYTESSEEKNLDSKITKFLEEEYSISKEDIRSYLFTVYSILALFTQTGDKYGNGIDPRKKIEMIKYTLKNSTGSVDDALIYSDIFKLVNNFVFTIEIKTLPFFGISNQYWIGHPCILYAKRPRLIGKAYEDVYDDFLSGTYRILKMKHEISSSNCESTFVLQKMGSTIGSPKKHEQTSKK